MKTVPAAIAFASGLLFVLWWGVAPPRSAAQSRPPMHQSQQQQCPGNSQLDGKLCVCPQGTSWSGAACTQVRPATPHSITLGPGAIAWPAAPRVGSMVHDERH